MHDVGYIDPDLHAVVAQRVHDIEDYTVAVRGYGTDAVFFFFLVKPLRLKKQNKKPPCGSITLPL